jgi:hypothetical protein
MPRYEDVVADLGYDPLAKEEVPDEPQTDTVRVIRNSKRKPSPRPR